MKAHVYAFYPELKTFIVQFKTISVLLHMCRPIDFVPSNLRLTVQSNFLPSNQFFNRPNKLGLGLDLGLGLGLDLGLGLCLSLRLGLVLGLN